MSEHLDKISGFCPIPNVYYGLPHSFLQEPIQKAPGQIHSGLVLGQPSFGLQELSCIYKASLLCAFWVGFLGCMEL
jgi:hypothetical protein